MSIWSRMADAIAALASGEGLSAVFDKLRANPDKTVAFAIAVIALGAKMAKADGIVTKPDGRISVPSCTTCPVSSGQPPSHTVIITTLVTSTCGM